MVLVENSHILIPLTPNELKEIVLRNRPNSSLSSKITPEAEVARQRLSIQYQVTVDNTKQGIWGLKSMSDFDSQ